MEDQPLLRKLPLTARCAEEIVRQGWKEGHSIHVTWFAKQLGETPGSLEFETAISEVRQLLEPHGLNLVGRGRLATQQFKIGLQAHNARETRNKTRRGQRLIERGLTLAVNTDRALLNDAERKQLDHVIEKTALKLLLLRRSGAVRRVLKKHNPELLENGDKPAGPPDGSGQPE